MSAPPLLAEIEATVSRMEPRYGGSVHFPAYVALCQRFEVDLIERRDLALAKSAALRLVKYLESED